MKLYLRMLAYVWHYKWRVMQVLVLSVVTTVLAVGSLGAMKPLFDTLFAGERPDLNVGLHVVDGAGVKIEKVEFQPLMPDGWTGRMGREWTTFRTKVRTLEGFRREEELRIPIVIKNGGNDLQAGIRLEVDTMGSTWNARVQMPHDVGSIQLAPGEKTTAVLIMTPVHGRNLFSGSFWQHGERKKIADWLQANVFANKYRALFIISGVMLITTFLKSLAAYYKVFWSQWISNRSMADMSEDLFESLISQSLNYFDRNKAGFIISRFTNSMGQMQRGMTALFSQVITEPLMVIGALSLALAINFKLALIGMIIFPLNSVFILVSGKLIRKSTKRSLGQRANMLQILQRSIEGIRIVKAFVMEDRTREGFVTANNQSFRYTMRGARAKSALQPVVEIFSAGFMIIFLLMGGVSVLRGEMSPGDFITFYASMIACYSPIKRINNAIADIQQSLPGAVDVFSGMDSISDVSDAPDAVPLEAFGGELKLDGVSFFYEKSAPVLRDINVTIRKGEFVALVGPSGAGKSTFVSLIPRFYDVTSGVISVDGKDIRRVTIDSLRGKIGIVTQEPILFHDTIANNIAFGEKDASRDVIIAAAKTAYAHEFIMGLPGGYETIVGDRGIMISGGERQRIALARAIIRDPEILLLDEATSSLDSESERLIQKAMDRFVQGRTTIAIAHRLSTILHADRIIVMDQGRIVEIGSHRELLANGGIYCRLHKLQFQVEEVPADDVPERHQPA